MQRKVHLSQNGGVLGLHHGVDDGLGVDHDLDAVIRCTKQVVGLNDLQALVHQCGGVDCDLLTHAAHHASIQGQCGSSSFFTHVLVCS